MTSSLRLCVCLCITTYIKPFLPCVYCATASSPSPCWADCMTLLVGTLARPHFTDRCAFEVCYATAYTQLEAYSAHVVQKEALSLLLTLYQCFT